MKNKILVISAFLIALLTACGCDMFRALAGRPTSSDLKAMRTALVTREAAEGAPRAAARAARV